ncbi:hypothetical protein [Thiolapillus sp.]|uniref:hypothetical protein n=1 Tax=Thiolapillus sp. TaxID=2017437 RepID=UPI003AF8E063
MQACLRPRERFWDIPVPKIDSAFDNLLVPQPSWSPSTTLGFTISIHHQHICHKNKMPHDSDTKLHCFPSTPCIKTLR